jgi:hypothetical protein
MAVAESEARRGADAHSRGEEAAMAEVRRPARMTICFACETVSPGHRGQPHVRQLRNEGSVAWSRCTTAHPLLIPDLIAYYSVPPFLNFIIINLT